MNRPERPATLDVPSAQDRATAEVLARAFHDDPFMSWMFPDDRRRLTASRRLFQWEIGHARVTGRAVTTTDADAAALWSAPKRWQVTGTSALRAGSIVLSAISPLRWREVVSDLGGIERAHPHEPHWYLATVGSDPDRRGRGGGAAVIEAVLERCDDEGVGAYLESSKKENISYYERFGFTVTDEISLSSAPSLWGMWRDPR